MRKIALVIPTCNAGFQFEKVAQLISEQSNSLDSLNIIDSASTDETLKIAKKYNFNISEIKKKDFSHSGTRTRIANELYQQGYKYMVLMTQDVFLQENALKNIINFILKSDKLGVVRGKQEVDLSKGNLMEYFTREKNYPNHSFIYTNKDKERKGIDVIYTSDAFAIYNLHALNKVGYFGETTEVSEDMFAAHKLVEAGYEIGYCSNAKVYHTHNYTLKQEFNRYVPIGRFYKDNDSWLRKYGKTESKGVKLVVKEVQFLIEKKASILIPYSILKNVLKYAGFQIGKRKRCKWRN